MKKFLFLLLCLGLTGCATLNPTYYTNPNSPGYNQAVYNAICGKCMKEFKFSRNQWDNNQLITCPYCSFTQDLKIAHNNYQEFQNTPLPHIHNRFITTEIISDPPGQKLK